MNSSVELNSNARKSNSFLRGVVVCVVATKKGVDSIWLRNASTARATSASAQTASRVWVSFDPRPDPQIKSVKKSKKVLFSIENRTFWSCWADSNRRPHPYQLQKSCCGLSLVIVPFCPHPFISNGCGIFLVVSCCFLL